MMKKWFSHYEQYNLNQKWKKTALYKRLRTRVESMWIGGLLLVLVAPLVGLAWYALLATASLILTFLSFALLEIPDDFS